MAKRPIDYPSASIMASDDVALIDGTTNNTRKLPVAGLIATIPNSSSSVRGLMTAADKAFLDTIGARLFSSENKALLDYFVNFLTAYSKLKANGLDNQLVVYNSASNPTPSYLGQLSRSSSGIFYVAVALSGSTMWQQVGSTTGGIATHSITPNLMAFQMAQVGGEFGEDPQYAGQPGRNISTGDIYIAIYTSGVLSWTLITLASLDLTGLDFVRNETTPQIELKSGDDLAWTPNWLPGSVSDMYNYQNKDQGYLNSSGVLTSSSYTDVISLQI